MFKHEAAAPAAVAPVISPGIPSAPGPAHWLVDVARRAGLAGSRDLAIGSQAPVSEAWPEVRRICQVSDEQMTALVAAQLKFRVANLGFAEPRALKLFPESVARRYGVFPIREAFRESNSQLEGRMWTWTY